MARLSYLFEYERTVPAIPATGTTVAVPAGTALYRSSFSCIPRVAKFLGIDT